MPCMEFSLQGREKGREWTGRRGVSRKASTWSPMQSRPCSQYLMSERGSLCTYSSGKLCLLGSWRQHAKLSGKVKMVGRCHWQLRWGSALALGHSWIGMQVCLQHLSDRSVRVPQTDSSPGLPALGRSREAAILTHTLPCHAESPLILAMPPPAFFLFNRWE